VHGSILEPSTGELASAVVAAPANKKVLGVRLVGVLVDVPLASFGLICPLALHHQPTDVKAAESSSTETAREKHDDKKNQNQLTTLDVITA
jgi:hypothetical protein